MWVATVVQSQLSTPNGVPQLDVTVKLDTDVNGSPLSVTVHVLLGRNDERNALRQKVSAITDAIDALNVVKDDLTATPQLDTSPQVVTDIQQQLNAELQILNQIQNLVKLGKIAPDDNVVTEQIQRFADVANKIIKPQANVVSVIQ